MVLFHGHDLCFCSCCCWLCACVCASLASRDRVLSGEKIRWMGSRRCVYLCVCAISDEETDTQRHNRAPNNFLSRPSRFWSIILPCVFPLLAAFDGLFVSSLGLKDARTHAHTFGTLTVRHVNNDRDKDSDRHNQPTRPLCHPPRLTHGQRRHFDNNNRQ